MALITLDEREADLGNQLESGRIAKILYTLSGVDLVVSNPFILSLGKYLENGDYREAPFYNCKALRSVDLRGCRMALIGDRVFSGCSNLETIQLESTVSTAAGLSN